MQHQRYVILVFVATGILAGVITDSACVALFERFAVADTRLLGLLNLSTLISLFVGIATFFGMLRSPVAVTYFDECIDELYKVTWPTREEAIRAATTVVVTTLMIAALVGGYDFLWKNVANVFLYTHPRG